HAFDRRVVHDRAVDAALGERVAHVRGPVALLAIDVRVDAQLSALDDGRVVRDVDCDGLLERDVLAIVGRDDLLYLVGRYGKVLRGGDLVDEVDEVLLDQPGAAVRDEVAEVGRLRGLVDQDAVAERDLDVAERVLRVPGLDRLTRLYLLLADPIAV